MVSSKMAGLGKKRSVIREIFEYGKKRSAEIGAENVFDFSIGNPNVEPPEEIKEIINKILNEEKPNFIHGYMNNSGYEDVREAIANHLGKEYNLELKCENIVMTCGAAGGLNVILKSILGTAQGSPLFHRSTL